MVRGAAKTVCVRDRECEAVWERLCVGESGLARERRACVWGVRSARTRSRSRGSAAAWPRGCAAGACPEPPAGLCASPPLSRAPRRLRACCLAGLVGAALGASGGVSAFVCVSITGCDFLLLQRRTIRVLPGILHLLRPAQIWGSDVWMGTGGLSQRSFCSLVPQVSGREGAGRQPIISLLLHLSWGESAGTSSLRKIAGRRDYAFTTVSLGPCSGLKSPENCT
ncbi:uncharacterized protein [Equus asinus]|uniref:uncharacterized protein n=1 Tax=Equus asinus TaxID=9793 RepID=UPI0038F7C1EB